MAWGPFNAGGGGGSSGGTAADISYDNSKSGISAANVQISIHALREEGDSKNRDKISIFKQIIQHSARI